MNKVILKEAVCQGVAALRVDASNANIIKLIVGCTVDVEIFMEENVKYLKPELVNDDYFIIKALEISN
ncbi:hypothetical protein [Carboxylicivirga sp. RSCT41]|uniref:hypothetical protein n=1 Tax=Carboxylicivirga agarovorans TaxID=3417570 RepID=UPI003D358CAE